MKKEFQIYKLNHNSAFTLIELAIVIVIIGLIVGGVLGANSLIETAKKQKIISQLREFKTAINAFYLEYDAIPGDLPNSTDYFDYSEFHTTDYIENDRGWGWYTKGDNIVHDRYESA